MNTCSYELMVTLKDAPDKIWPRIKVPGNIDLISLHKVLQKTMGWDGHHLYCFKNSYGEVFAEPGQYPGKMQDAGQVHLKDILRNRGDRMTYIYDFGVNWTHEITVRNIEPKPESSPICRSGSCSYKESRIVEEESLSNLIENFLEHQQQEVTRSTYQKYARSIKLLESALDSYGYLHSDIDYDSVQEAGKTFCQVAGLSPLLQYLPEFFDYFMARKLFATVKEVKEQRTTVRKFLKWLGDENIIPPESAKYHSKKVLAMSKDAISAARVRDYPFTPVEVPDMNDVDDILEDHFTVKEINSDQIWLEGVPGEDEAVAVCIPKDFADLAEIGMDLAAEMQLANDRWYLIDVYNAYPKM